jgi:ribosomal protein L7Ae-like RNA K-turn-binding protein
MNRALGLLGLCARAGKVQSGEQACELAIRRRQAYLIVLDGAASQGTRKAFSDACAYHAIPICLTDAHALGTAIGKPGRRAAVITDEKLAQKVAALLPALLPENKTAEIHND